VNDGEADSGGDGGTEHGWPVDLAGVTETVTTTLGPNGRWNAAALGVRAGGRAPDSDPDSDSDSTSNAAPGSDAASARTWGRTRTRRNFEREAEGYVQFVRDPVLFVEAALGVSESDDPVLPAARAWTRVAVERRDAGEEGGTEWVEWALHPVESRVVETTVPTLDRGHAAVVEATVAASRLGVPAYDDGRLRARLAYFDGVARECGGDRERAAMDRLVALCEWSPPADRE
jgi:hypothetical protein